MIYVSLSKTFCMEKEKVVSRQENFGLTGGAAATFTPKRVRGFTTTQYRTIIMVMVFLEFGISYHLEF